MSRRVLRGAPMTVLAVLALAACDTQGRSADYALAHTPTLAGLAHGEWTATGIDDPNRDIVPGSTIVLTFGDDSVSAQGGCNSLHGSASIGDHQLVVGTLASTRKACDQPLEAQDDWLGSFLTSRPTIERQGNDLWLSRDDTTLRFVSSDSG